MQVTHCWYGYACSLLVKQHAHVYCYSLLPVTYAWSAQQFFASDASGGSATCPKTLDFPNWLGSVTVLGLNQQAAPSTVTVRAGNGAPTTVNADFDAAAKKLVINNLGRNLSCPDNIVISW